MKNIWFDGGAWTCAWGAGVTQYLKQHYPDIINNYDNIGGYSAGGVLAGCHYLDFEEPDFWYCFEHEIHGFGKYHKWSEECAKRLWEKDKNNRFLNDNKLTLVIFSTKKMKPILRNQWSSKYDFINFTKATVHIPILCSPGFLKVLDFGYSMDGGLTHRNPPKEWEDTFIISPWRKSSKSIIGATKSPPKNLLIEGDFEACKKLFDQGIEDAKIWIKNFR